ncbi:NAD-P-binding protein [Trametes polyzona]|nr:NAD-P-binding protein [Trametes polyzona]
MPMLKFFLALIRNGVLFPGKPKWTGDHLPDLSNKVYIVTGGNTGIGRATVKGLLLKNAKVYLAARSKEKAARAIEELHEETDRTAHFLQLDLGDLDAVKTAVEEFKKEETQLDAIVLNAGVLCPPRELLTAQGYDGTFGTNVIGHFLLVRLLYPLLSASGRESDPSRVVWLSSMGNHEPYGLTYEVYRDGPIRQKVDLFSIYGESKLAAVLMSNYLARSCASDNVVSIAVDPGCIKSEIYRSAPLHLRLFDMVYWYPVEHGAVSPLYAAAAPEAAACNGKYIQPWVRIAQPNPFALDAAEQDKLWAWLEDQVKGFL